jgi:transmembrane sensor
MGNAQEDFWTLVAKKFSDELSEKEEQQLRELKESNPEKKAAYEQMEQNWKQMQAPADHFQPETERGWQRFKFRMESERGFYDPEPGETPPEAGRTRRLLPPLTAIAASVILLLAAGIWWWQSASSPEVIMLTTGKNERQMYWLPDSSQVWLNEHSQLSYAADFDKEHRVVQLAGEAFFEVKEAEGRRFTIFSEGAKTEVIGTSFNLSAYPEEPVVVQVVSGKVAFSPAGEDNAVFLEPGQQAVMKNQLIVEHKTAIKDPNFRAWQSQQLLFSNTSLQEVISLLEDVYHTEIRLDNPDLANCRYTATFEGASLEEILYVLSVTGDLSFEQQGSSYIISGQACQ